MFFILFFPRLQIPCNDVSRSAAKLLPPPSSFGMLFRALPGQKRGAIRRGRPRAYHLNLMRACSAAHCACLRSMHSFELRFLLFLAESNDCVHQSSRISRHSTTSPLVPTPCDFVQLRCPLDESTPSLFSLFLPLCLRDATSTVASAAASAWLHRRCPRATSRPFLLPRPIDRPTPFLRLQGAARALVCVRLRCQPLSSSLPLRCLCHAFSSARMVTPCVFVHRFAACRRRMRSRCICVALSPLRALLPPSPPRPSSRSPLFS